MIIEYESRYDEEIKDLLVELQEYIVSIDMEKYNIITPKYRDKYFKKTFKEIDKYNGKILLAKEDDKIVGLIVGLVNNDELDDYDFKAPKRGRISELIVSKNCRSHGTGSKLL
jgi:ribosomal protein S18 acetylase RimI-like enzyme